MRLAALGRTTALVVAGLLVIVGALAVLVMNSVRPQFGKLRAAAAQEVDCQLTVPANPLSAQGLATPWALSGQGDMAQQCVMTNPNGQAFVQGTILTPQGQLMAYDPLVITARTQPAVAPTAPSFPAGSTVALSVGFQGNNLTLVGPGVQQGNCVNGADGTIFGQVSFCNGPNFFAAASQQVQAGTLKIPAAGTGKDGMPCQTTRSFALVDQDQSDNVTTTYLLNGNGQTAQDTAGNRTAVAGAQPINNGSDNFLLDHFVDPALGCTPFQVSNLADAGRSVEATQQSNELQAQQNQAPPIALVPALDPMVLNNNNPDLNKVNAYRVSVGQPAAAALNGASTTRYCTNLLQTGLPAIAGDKGFTQGQLSPMPAVATDLFLFLAQRFQATWMNLTCQNLTGLQNPVTTVQDGNGVVVQARINLHPAPVAAASPSPSPSQSPSPSPTAPPSATPPPSQSPSPSPTHGQPAGGGPPQVPSPAPSPMASPSPSPVPSPSGPPAGSTTTGITTTGSPDAATTVAAGTTSTGTTSPSVQLVNGIVGSTTPGMPATGAGPGS